MLSPNNDGISVDHSLSDDHGRGYFDFLLTCHESPLLAIKSIDGADLWRP